MNNYIYTITEPSKNRVIYVGRTTDPVTRFRTHMCKNNTAIGHALQNLKSNKIAPIFTIIENCEYLMASKREKHWINHFSKNGNILFNVERRKKDVLYKVEISEGIQLDKETKEAFEI